MIVNGVTAPVISPTSVLVPAGTTVCKYVDAGPYADSANGVAVLNYNFTTTQGTVFDSLSTSFNSLPPCGTGADPGNNPGDDPPHVPDGPA